MNDQQNDRLEDFIKKNRQEFDEKTPKDHIWKSIDQRILSTTKPWYRQEVWLWRAASVVLLMLSLFLYQNNEKPVQPLAVTSHHEFDQVEGYYASMISEKRNQIDDFREEKIEVDQAYIVDLQRLDAMYEVLKEELSKNPSKEVKDALTLNLLIRIDLLNNQLQVIEELDKSELIQQSV